jgi:hypothetical protein
MAHAHSVARCSSTPRKTATAKKHSSQHALLSGNSARARDGAPGGRACQAAQRLLPGTSAGRHGRHEMHPSGARSGELGLVHIAAHSRRGGVRVRRALHAALHHLPLPQRAAAPQERSNTSHPQQPLPKWRRRPKHSQPKEQAAAVACMLAGLAGPLPPVRFRLRRSCMPPPVSCTRTPG